MNTYIPKPLDTSSITLPDSLNTLLEKLAENTHEVWAAQRLNTGWTYGATRNDTNKTHPCLVPYGQLPESEKEYDRLTVAQTLKAIMKLGYHITK